MAAITSRPTEDAAEPAVTSLIQQVGERVRAARKSQRLSRRVLSERSGVSPRYLAQLESGEGNISIGRLCHVAMALQLPIENLVAADQGQAEDMQRLIALVRRMDTATRARLLRELDPDGQPVGKAQRICLIGLRGAGKSTLGARLGKALDMPFIELNKEIEHSAGIPISETIALYGDAGYRKLEAETLHDIIATRDRCVLAVAGGVVEQSNTYSELLERFHTVWLQADAVDHMERVRAQGDLRPMAGNPRAMVQLRQILAERESRYRQAAFHLPTSGRSVDGSLTELRALIDANKILAGAPASTHQAGATP